MKLVLPDVTFDSERTIRLGGREIRLFYLGPGQQAGDTFADQHLVTGLTSFALLVIIVVLMPVIDWLFRKDWQKEQKRRRAAAGLDPIDTPFHPLEDAPRKAKRWLEGAAIVLLAVLTASFASAQSVEQPAAGITPGRAAPGDCGWQKKAPPKRGSRG